MSGRFDISRTSQHAAQNVPCSFKGRRDVGNMSFSKKRFTALCMFSVLTAILILSSIEMSPQSPLL